MTTIEDMTDEVRMLELELRKLELIRQLKAEPPIDGEYIGCAGPISVVDVAAKLQGEIDGMKRVHANQKKDLHHLNTIIDELILQLAEKRAIINKITRLRVDEVDTTQDLKAELSVREEDHKVLMDVVGIVNDIYDLIGDYLGVQVPHIKEDDPSINEDHHITVKVGFLEL